MKWRALGLVFYIRDVAGSVLSTPASLRALLQRVIVCGVCAGTAPSGQPQQWCPQDSLSDSHHREVPLAAAFAARGWCGLLSSCCSMRKEGLLCTTLTPNTHLASAHCWTFFHIHMNAAASVPGITRNLSLAALAQLQSCFSLTSPLL